MSDIKVIERYIYPINSLPGLRLTKMEIDENGLVLDHQWMLVDEKNELVSLKQRPDLTLFRVSLGNFVELTWKDGDSMDFGLSETEGEPIEVSLWDKKKKAREVSEEVSEWFSNKLDQKVKLLRIEDESSSEGRLVHILSKASLDLLDMKVGKKTAVSRFRPNLIVDNLEAHEEDVIEGFYIGKVEFHLERRKNRCRVIGINPLTAELTEEPMKTLSTYRKEEDGEIYFGAYYTTKGVGTV